MPQTRQKRALLVIVSALFIFCTGIWSAAYASSAHVQGKQELRLVVLDVGQGDAIFIESPTGVQVLIDGGLGGAVLGELAEVMPLGDYSLDAVVATHPDADHIGGLVGVVERFAVGAFVEPGIPKDTATYRALERAVDESGAPRVLARRGMVMEMGQGAVLKVLYPDYDVSVLPGSRANEGGIVMRLQWGQAAALLMADVGTGVENHLMQLNEGELDADVLKVGHHGSRYSSGTSFVQAVSPEVAVISVGAHNSYGHPTQQTLTNLATVGAAILRTDQNGAVECISSGADFECE